MPSGEPVLGLGQWGGGGVAFALALDFGLGLILIFRLSHPPHHSQTPSSHTQQPPEPKWQERFFQTISFPPQLCYLQDDSPVSTSPSLAALLAQGIPLPLVHRLDISHFSVAVGQVSTDRPTNICVFTQK